MASKGGYVRQTVGFVLTLVGAGCGPGVRFPDKAASLTQEESHKLVAYDVSGDGKPDYLQRLDPFGRKTALYYIENGQRSPAIELDEISPAECPHLMIVLDGVPFELVQQLYDEGYFRLFHRPARVISCYPSMTDLALAEAFHAGPCLGMEALYFDRETRKLSDGNKVYLSGANAPWTPQVNYRCSTWYDAQSYLNPRAVFNHEMRQIGRTFVKVKEGHSIGYSVGSAGIGTRFGRKGIIDYLVVVDRYCEQVVYERRGRVKLSMFADHGHNMTRCPRISFRKPLEAAGYRWTKTMTDPKKDVVPIEYGLVTYAALATGDAQGVADVALKQPWVDLAFYPEPAGAGSDSAMPSGGEVGAVIVRSPTGEARITAGPNGYGYRTIEGDPLELRPVIEKLAAAGKVTADGVIDDAALFEATVTHKYPDPLARVWRGFHGLVKNPPDLILNLRDEYSHGSAFFAAMVGSPQSTHGSLNLVNSTTFAMTMRGELPKAMRIETVLGAIEAAGMSGSQAPSSPRPFTSATP